MFTRSYTSSRLENDCHVWRNATLVALVDYSLLMLDYTPPPKRQAYNALCVYPQYALHVCWSIANVTMEGELRDADYMAVPWKDDHLSSAPARVLVPFSESHICST